MARVTVDDLRTMKKDGQKVVAVIVYHYQMSLIADKAGADVLTVGDSLGRNILGQPDVLDCTVDDLIPFAKPVDRGRERSAVASTALKPLTPSVVDDSPPEPDPFHTPRSTPKSYEQMSNPQGNRADH